MSHAANIHLSYGSHTACGRETWRDPALITTRVHFVVDCEKCREQHRKKVAK